MPACGTVLLTVPLHRSQHQFLLILNLQFALCGQNDLKENTKENNL